MESQESKTYGKKNWAEINEDKVEWVGKEDGGVNVIKTIGKNLKYVIL